MLEYCSPVWSLVTAVLINQLELFLPDSIELTVDSIFFTVGVLRIWNSLPE